MKRYEVHRQQACMPDRLWFEVRELEVREDDESICVWFPLANCNVMWTDSFIRLYRMLQNQYAGCIYWDRFQHDINGHNRVPVKIIKRVRG